MREEEETDNRRWRKMRKERRETRREQREKRRELNRKEVLGSGQEKWGGILNGARGQHQYGFQFVI